MYGGAHIAYTHSLYELVVVVSKWQDQRRRQSNLLWSCHVSHVEARRPVSRNEHTLSLAGHYHNRPAGRLGRFLPCFAGWCELNSDDVFLKNAQL